MPRLARLLLLVVLGSPALLGRLYADGPKDNLPEQVRRIPAPGIEVPAADGEVLQRDLARLEKAIEKLRASKDAKVKDLLPDVQIFFYAVHDAPCVPRVLHPSPCNGRQEPAGDGPQAGRPTAGRPGAMDQRDWPGPATATSSRSTARCNRMGW